MTLPKNCNYGDRSGPYPHVTQNVDFKHLFYLVVLSRENVSSCNHTNVVHQDGHIPNILLHLLERRKKPKFVSVTQREKKKRYMQGWGR